MRAGLAMFFVTLDDPGLDALAERIVAELEIEWFFNIQLVGEHVIEVNPRISTIVYQEDLNLPYLGVKRALGEIADDELAALKTRAPEADGAQLLRPGRVGRVGERPLRVVHCPVNTAGIPWTNVQALRRAAWTPGSSSSSATGCTPRRTGRSSGAAASSGGRLTQWRALARLLPRTDVFHFVFGLTLVPQSVQFPSCGPRARSR